jgi:general L-amino acid transport system permease protein
MTSPSHKSPPRKRDWSWRSRALRGVLYQIVAVVLLGVLLWFLASNTVENMKVRGIQSGFDFLKQPAGFGIGESIFNFDSSDSYILAFLVGLTNTLRAAIVGIILTTILGVLVGIGRLSRNYLVRKLCTVYVETFRNVPLLLQLLMWYFAITNLLPQVSEALQPLPGVYLSQSGLQFPIPVWAPAYLYAIFGLFAGIAAAWWYHHAAVKHLEQSGQPRAVLWPSIAFIVIGPLLGWLLGGAPTALDVPEMGGFNIAGGGSLTPEYITVVLGLTLYTASYLAEIVRGGILSVPFGQTEASSALGLSRRQMFRLVLLPQALRVIIPPATSQYLNLTKNSSLAVAVGYPDLVSITTTTLNQTGRAVECISIMMAVYLTLSLLTAALMNWYNLKVAIKQR